MDRRRYLSVCAAGSTALVAGCAGSGDDGESEQQDNQEVYADAFRDALTRDDIEIREFRVEDRVVVLEYSPGELPADADEATVEKRVQESIDTAASAYFGRIHGPGDSRWAVDRLEADVVVGGSVVASWRLETEWVLTCVERSDVRECLGSKIEASVERYDDGA
jgi:hypothetical protein